MSSENHALEAQALRAEVEALRDRLRSEQGLRLAFEAKYQALLHDVLPMLLARALPSQEINIGRLTGPTTIEGATMSRDSYKVHGQAAAVGPGARAHDNTFQQIQSGLDLPKLAEELGRLRTALKGEAAGTREQDKAIGAVADAEEAAARGDDPASLGHLKGAGKWALSVAEKIGVPLAVEALKRAML